MRVQKILSLFTSLVLSTLLMTSSAYAGFRIRLEKDISTALLTSLGSVSFSLYDSETATTPVDTQTFAPGSYSIGYELKSYPTPPNDSIYRFRVDFTNTENITKDMGLWFELKIDGVVQGTREKINQEAWALFSKEASFADEAAHAIQSDNSTQAINANTVGGITAAQLQIPSGVIVMWNSAIESIPTGWAICNGSNGTPDLRDRFIVGAGSSYSTGNMGGSTTHTHGAGSYTGPSHTHSGSAGSPSDRRWVDDNSGGSDHWVSGESHSHSFTTNSSGNQLVTGTSAATDNLPPYYAIAFIMKL